MRFTLQTEVFDLGYPHSNRGTSMLYIFVRCRTSLFEHKQELFQSEGILKTGVVVVMYNSIDVLSTSVSRVILSHEDMPVILTHLITIKYPTKMPRSKPRIIPS
jgi:uncharacterized membrane protein (UPF0136 family)